MRLDDPLITTPWGEPLPDGHVFAGLPRNGFPCVYADPNWEYATRSGKGKGKSADQHYRTAPFGEIAAMPVGDLASADSFLFLWMTNPYTPRVGDLMRAWGFEFSGVFQTWVKLNKSGTGIFMSTGYGSRQNTERVYLGRRGSPKRLSRSIREVVFWPLMEHSRKPDVVRSRIRRFCPGPRVELYSRHETPGWTSWGDEVGMFRGTDQEESTWTTRTS